MKFQQGTFHGVPFLRNGLGSLHDYSTWQKTSSCVPPWVPEAPPLPLSSLTSVCAGLFTSFSSVTELLHNIILSFLYYVITDGSSAWIMGSVLGPFRAVWNQLCPTSGSPRLPLTEATPPAHCATKSLPCQPNTMSLTAKDDARHFAESCVTFYRLFNSSVLELHCKATAKAAVATEVAIFSEQKIVQNAIRKIKTIILKVFPWYILL